MVTEGCEGKSEGKSLSRRRRASGYILVESAHEVRSRSTASDKKPTRVVRSAEKARYCSRRMTAHGVIPKRASALDRDTIASQVTVHLG